jgi:hypothetical protein
LKVFSLKFNINLSFPSLTTSNFRIAEQSIGEGG